MRLNHLRITDYRNLRSIELEFPEDVAVVVGANAQGKSNLLEAIYLLATMRSTRVETDAQLIRRDALEDVLPAARVVGEASTAEGPLKIEVTIVARPGAKGPIATKTVKVNGVAKRLSDATGRLTAVLFTAEDLEMISGTPSLRRRYLDLTLTQIDPHYSAARSRFERVLTQRNSLLKRIREGVATTGELEFWDEQLASDGAVLFRARAVAVERIATLAGEAHAELAPGEALAVEYLPKLEHAGRLDEMSEPDIREAYARSLSGSVSRDTGAGMTTQGPHRDDVAFTLDGLGAAGFASRAQQRTIALSLRLAETQLLRERRGEAPVLLLDDILSEMDAARRRSVLAAVGVGEQMLVTGTDWDRFPAEFVAGASLFEVDAGSVRPVERTPGAKRSG
ncbi:MAG TPA: DNA replication/repair protein RecF [Dehalococcoidia bacterium]|nr:DNA replication/repair protein RecF [Dehalococcoidia bacterium]